MFRDDYWQFLSEINDEIISKWLYIVQKYEYTKYFDIMQKAISGSDDATLRGVTMYLVACLFWKITLVNIEKLFQSFRINLHHVIDRIPVFKMLYIYYITYSWIISGADIHVLFCANLAQKLMK